jgi:GST-like protein
MYQLFGRKGWGSALTELQLGWYGLPYHLEEVDDLFQSAEARQRLARVNPVAQLPTLLLPDGTVMTESAAITLHLADVTGSRELVPPVGNPTRPRFLRWLVFLVANIYPTFTYADDPARFVTGEAAQAAFRESVDAYAQRLWGLVENEATGPWFLGERFSALDIYIAVMTHWRPRRPWFAEHCPCLTAIALAAEAEPKLADVWARNFAESTF